MSCLVAGCGSIRYYQHKGGPPYSSKLQDVHLKVGQRVKVLKHSSGLMWGGYIHGVAVEDLSIVEVQYGKDGKGDRWDPLVSLVGVKPGHCRAAYVNRMGDFPDFENGDDLRKNVDGAFTVYVE